jgi:magnesium-transporting ATPase (P-type)
MSAAAPNAAALELTPLDADTDIRKSAATATEKEDQFSPWVGSPAGPGVDHVEPVDLLNLEAVHILSRATLARRYNTAVEQSAGGTGTGSTAAPATSSLPALAAPSVAMPERVPGEKAGPKPIVVDAGAGRETGLRKRLSERHRELSSMSVGEVDLRASAGLGEEEHARRLAELGPNVVKPLEGTPAWLRYLSLYIQPFMIALMLAAVLSLAMYGTDTSERVNLQVGLCLLFVIIFSCTSEFYQEHKSKSRMSAFAALVPRQAMVVRGGRRVVVPAASLVIGDLVVLRTGDQAAADMRLIHVNGLKVDSSAVTGEAEPITCSPFYDGTDASEFSPAKFDALEAEHEAYYVNSIRYLESARRVAAAAASPKGSAAATLTEKPVVPTSPADIKAFKIAELPLNEAKNIIFAGCSVLEGEGMGVVFATADRSMVGQIIQLTSAVEQKISSLQAEIIRLVAIMGVSALVQVVLILVVCLARGDDMAKTFTQSVIIVILANIPQGLPTAVMTSMVVIAGRMINAQVYVKQLANIETLGCATVIASDKTGTLTQNKMTVTRLWFDGVAMSPDEALEAAHPSAVFTRFDPLAFVNANAYSAQQGALMAPPPASSTDADGEGAEGAMHKPRSATAASLPELIQYVSNAAMTNDPQTRLHHTLAILDLVAAVCNQTRYEDESVMATGAAVEEIGSGAALSFPALRLESYKRKDWVEREGARAAAADSQLGRKAIGEPSDLAIFNYVANRQSIELLRFKLPVIFHLPFNSTNKFVLTAVDQIGPSSPLDRVLVLMKGAPEIVLARCAYYHHGGRRYNKSAAFEKRFNEQYTSFAGDGERVIACAYLEMSAHTARVGSLEDAVFDPADETARLPTPGASRQVPLPSAPAKWSDKTMPVEGFTFVGLFSLADPPKVTVPAAVKAVREAGVKVVMVTGDHPLTAKAIARQIGIITLPTDDEVDEHGNVKLSASTAALQQQKERRLAGAPDDAGAPLNAAALANAASSDVGAAVAAERAVAAVPDQVDVCVIPQRALVATGGEIRNWTEDQWTANLQRPEIVFARTTPQQKLQIVEHMQRLKHIVCVTGDGVNDSPALKKANIGVAMGISGSDVARDAADIVLLDDDFASIVAGIKEGRLLFINLTKVVVYTLTHLWVEVIPALSNILLRIPLAISSMAVLAIDCGTEIVPSVSLAYQQPEGDIMRQPPRDTQKDRLVSPRVITYVFGPMGLLMTMTCFTAYLFTFYFNDVALSDLLNSTGTYWQDDSPVYVGPTGRTFTAQQQLDLVADAQVSYWMTVVLSQAFHIFLCKTRTVPFWHYGIFDNMVLVWGVLIELCIMFALIYIPTINSEGFGFGTVYDRAWAVPFMGWVAFFAYCEGSKWIRRNYPDSKIAKYVGQ